MSERVVCGGRFPRMLSLFLQRESEAKSGVVTPPESELA